MELTDLEVGDLIEVEALSTETVDFAKVVRTNVKASGWEGHYAISVDLSSSQRLFLTKTHCDIIPPMTKGTKALITVI